MKVYVLMSRMMFGGAYLEHVFDSKEKAIKWVTDHGFTYDEVGDELYFIVEKEVR